MNLKLKRSSFEAGGIFGALSSVDESCQVSVTLEHSYPSSIEPISYIPKLPPGVYTCVRGMHQLASMSHPFETFEIMDVPGHSKILFHIGNTNDDSEGCVLLGAKRLGTMITFSRIAFERFMKLQTGVNAFSLVVE